MAGAALLLSGRKTPWALGILVCYVAFGSVFGNLPQAFNPDVGASAIAGLLSNLAVIGGLLYWLHAERAASSNALVSDGLTKNGEYAGQPLVYAGDPTPKPLRDDDRQGSAGDLVS